MEGSTRSGKGLRHNTFTVRNRKGVTTQITHQPRRIRHVKHTKHPRRSRRPTHRRNTGPSHKCSQPGKPTSPNTSKEPNSSKNVTGKRIHTRYFNYRFLLFSLLPLLPLLLSYSLAFLSMFSVLSSMPPKSFLSQLHRNLSTYMAFYSFTKSPSS